MESVRSVRLGAIRMETELRAQRVHRILRVPTGRALRVETGLRRMGIRRRASRARRLTRGREVFVRCVRRGASRMVTSPRV